MTEQREGMTELGEGKTELDKLIKAAQAVVDICDRKVIIGVLEPVASNCIETLRQAVEQAKVVEAVGEFVDADGCDCVRWDESKPKLPYGTKLYTTPPSINALIADAVAKEREACAQIALPNWRIAEEIRARGNE